MSFFRCRWRREGGSVHARVYVMPTPAATPAYCGELVMTADQFEEFASVAAPGIALVQEPEVARR